MWANKTVYSRVHGAIGISHVLNSKMLSKLHVLHKSAVLNKFVQFYSLKCAVGNLANGHYTLCITLKAKTGKIVLVTLCIQIEWLFCNVRLV